MCAGLVAQIPSLGRSHINGHPRIASFVAEPALAHMEADRYFLFEQPNGSDLLKETEWQLVCAHPDTVCIVVHQCATGLRNEQGLLCMKPTMLTPNSQRLLDPFAKCACDGKHQRGTVGTKRQHWTRDFARRIIDGIIALKQDVATGMYPIAESEKGKYRGCEGCRKSLAAGRSCA